MKKELQDKLFEKYPKLYRQKDLDKTQTAMCWGMSCGSGWYNIIDNLSATIQNRVDYLNGEGQHTYRDLPEDHVKVVCEAVQVKEKFGSLVAYVEYDDSEDKFKEFPPVPEHVFDKIREISSRGWKLCRTCGKEKIETVHESRVQYRCLDHYDETTRWKVRSC